MTTIHLPNCFAEYSGPTAYCIQSAKFGNFVHKPVPLNEPKPISHIPVNHTIFCISCDPLYVLHFIHYSLSCTSLYIIYYCILCILHIPVHHTLLYYVHLAHPWKSYNIMHIFHIPVRCTMYIIPLFCTFCKPCLCTSPCTSFTFRCTITSEHRSCYLLTNTLALLASTFLLSPANLYVLLIGSGG